MTESQSHTFHETSESFDAGKHGKDYELELSKFVFKRVLDSEFRDFRFTREKKGLGKFDDLVLIYETAETQRYTLIQLKHCLDDSKLISFESLAGDKSSYFYLPKYFDHYLESSKNISEDPDFDNATLGELIICTNIKFAQNLSFIEKIKLKNEGLFRHSGELYKLRASNAVKKKVFASSYVSDQMKLAEELCLFAMLNKPIDLSSLIRDDHVSLIKSYHVALAQFVVDVPNKRFKTEFLENTLINNPDVSGFRESLFKACSDFLFAYKDSEVDKLKYDFNLSRKKAEELASVLQEYNPKEGLVDFLKDARLIFKGPFGDCVSCREYFPSLPNNEIDADKIDKDISRFLGALTFAVDQKNNENIIRNELEPSLMLAFTDKMNQWYHEGSYKGPGDSSTRKREWITKARLVSQARDALVLFQGKKIKMNQVVGEDYSFDSDLLMRMFCSLEIQIGNAFVKNKIITQYYIPRVLFRQKLLDINVLKEGRIDVILMSSLDVDSGREEIEELLPEEATLFDLDHIKLETHFVYVSNNFQDDDFAYFVSKYKEQFEWKNVHWMQVKSGQLIWRNSWESLNVLHKYFRNCDLLSESINESQLPNSGRFIVLTGEPGMGKSALIQTAAYNLSKPDNNKQMWILKIMSEDCQRALKMCELHGIQNLNDVIEFLFEAAKLKGTFCKSILAYSISTSNLILILDGFDELNLAKNQQKILKILKFLKLTSNVRQIWVSTRPHLKKPLEDCLGVVSFSIKEINEEEQKTFLFKYWKHNSTISDEHIHQHTEKLVKYFNVQISDHERNFLGVPLQTYMFAVAFLQEIVKGEPHVQNRIPINFLFKQFLRTKYSIYLNKSKESSLPEDIKQLFMQSLDEAHQNFALNHGGCLSEDWTNLFIMEGKTITADTILKIGIVYKCNESFYFIHKTLCEYLLAKRISNVVICQERNLDDYKNLIEQLISKAENKFFLYLFDIEMTEGFPLHRAVLNGERERVKNFQRPDVNATDTLGRSLAYYAVQYNHFDIIKMLLHMGAFSGDYDHFLMMSLISHIKNSYNASLERVHNNAKLFSLLFRFSSNYSLKLVRAFDIHLEMRFKSWSLVRKLLTIYRLNSLFSDSIYILESALKFKAPIDVVMFILESVQLSKEPLDPSFMTYSHFMTYIFICDFQVIEKILSQYKISFKTFYRKLPLFVGIYEYFDLRTLSFENSVFPVLGEIRKRAERYTSIVRLLLEHGASYIILPNKHIEDIFSDIQYSARLVKKPIEKYLDDIYTSNFLNSPLNIIQDRSEPIRRAEYPSCCTESARDFWINFESYIKDFPQDMNQSVKESVVKTVVAVLKSSGAARLLYLVFNFFEAITANNYEGVRRCLKEAKGEGWTAALLNATNSDFETGQDLAKTYFYFRIYILLRKQRAKLQKSRLIIS